MNLSSPSDDVGGALEIDHDSASLKQPHSAITETSSLSASSITPRSKSNGKSMRIYLIVCGYITSRRGKGIMSRYVKKGGNVGAMTSSL
jgi:hypothetical protein